ncbi:MAG: ABC transporter substrate-binding protein [Solirubrobacteraceae bacterium]|nr:ABC transporter substrate-binding protein [Solirubrobacteraceae bacterium]
MTSAVAALSATAIFAAACGSDSDKSSDSGSGGAATAEAKSGGDFTGTYSSFPDYLDPALSYTAEGWTTLWPNYTGLLTFKHAEGAEGSELAPGLAEALPEISEDGLTYKLKLRSGLKYSDGSPVKASDFEHTIKRVLNLESGGSAFYLSIEGAEAYVKAGKADGDISGITADDATGDITIKLATKDGQFSFYLAMDFAGLVKGDTPFENATDKPAVGYGPYSITEVKPNRSVTMTKNPNFTPLPDVPEGKADSITINVVKNQRRQAQDVINDQVDFLIDPPTPDQIREVKAKAGDRYKEEITNSTYYYFLNLRTKPFDDERVRQAVGYAVDERALARIFGGLLAPSCNFLPPGMIGYEKVDPCPWGEPGTADVEKAKALIKEAGAEGTEVTVWGNDEDPSSPVTEYLADTLNSIGLKAKPRIVDGSVYFQTIGNQKTKAQTGFANWFQDFPSPANFMFLVDGASIQETNNQNFGNVDDKEINKLIADAKANPDINAVKGEWAKADKLLVDKAYVIPYGNRKLTKITSSRVNFDAFQFNPVYNHDLTTLGLK